VKTNARLSDQRLLLRRDGAVRHSLVDVGLYSDALVLQWVVGSAEHNKLRNDNSIGPKRSLQRRSYGVCCRRNLLGLLFPSDAVISKRAGCSSKWGNNINIR
jgi:hypothetical protein